MFLAEFLWRFCSPNTNELKISQGVNQDHTGGAELTVIGLYGSQSNKNAREINFERIFPSAASKFLELGLLGFFCVLKCIFIIIEFV